MRKTAHKSHRMEVLQRKMQIVSCECRLGLRGQSMSVQVPTKLSVQMCVCVCVWEAHLTSVSRVLAVNNVHL